MQQAAKPPVLLHRIFLIQHVVMEVSKITVCCGDSPARSYPASVTLITCPDGGTWDLESRVLARAQGCCKPSCGARAALCTLHKPASELYPVFREVQLTDTQFLQVALS